MYRSIFFNWALKYSLVENISCDIFALEILMNECLK